MMLPPASDRLLERDRAAILAEILAARSAYAPDWMPSPGGAGHGIADISAGFLELLQERLRRIPAHRQAVLLDLLGASALPAQGARTHVLLTALPGTRGARVPQGTRIGATVRGRSEPVVFETQQDVAISPAIVVELHSVDPAADAEQDHSADLLAHRPFTIFGAPTPVQRALYIGHDDLLAFDGRAVVELGMGLTVPAAEPLPLEWQWWDGTLWRPFAEVAESPLAADDDASIDGTFGLSRSGTVRLVAPTAAAKPLTVDGRETHWIRGVLTSPVAGVPTLPTISRLRLVVVNEHRRLRVHRSASNTTAQATVWWPDAPAAPIALHVVDAATGVVSPAYVAGQPPPVSKEGAYPALGASLTAPLGATSGRSIRLGVSPAASRPAGAATETDPKRVALIATDDLTDAFLPAAAEQVDLTVAQGLPLDKGIADARAVDLTKTFAPLGPSPVQGTAFLFACETATRRPGSRVSLLVERPSTAAEEADAHADLQRNAAGNAKKILEESIELLKGGDCKGALEAAIAELDRELPKLPGTELVDGAGAVLRSGSQWFAELRMPIRAGIAAAMAAMTQAELITPGIAALALSPIPDPFTGGAVIAGIVDRIEAARNSIAGLETRIPELIPNGLLAMEPTAFVSDVRARLGVVRGHVSRALATVRAVIAKLESIGPASLAVELAQKEAMKLTPAVLAWEYHDGTRWRALGVDGDPQVRSLNASGALHFTVPDDIAAVEVDGDVRRWRRARLASGSYARMSLVSWTDTQDTVNFLPVVEPRAPMLDRIDVFYTHRSDPVDAGAVVAVDAHEVRDLTQAVTWPGPGGTPFSLLPERAPTLYLGLDGDLPTDRVGVWVQPSEVSPWSTPHRPLWEGWNGREWTRLESDDGTDGFRREGVVGLLWPGTDAAPGIAVSGALGTTIRLLGRGAAARLEPGERLMIADLQGQEPVVVAAAEGEIVTTRSALSRSYAGAQLVEAPPARFGVPRTWIRATFDPASAAPRLPLTSLAAHAVEVAQLETLQDEPLGSGDGSPRQVLVARRFPFAGVVDLEVRELDGDRADLDRDVLTRTLEASGVDLASVRTVTERRTGRVTEVWVPWTEVSSLGAAGPDDRVYVVDRAQGRVICGGDGHGRPFPAGRDNVRLRSYPTTSGAAGNVPAGAIDKLLSAVAVGEIANPLAATGGADVEQPETTLPRAAALVRHRRLALTESDVEAIAIEASPAVVRARAL